MHYLSCTIKRDERRDEDVKALRMAAFLAKPQFSQKPNVMGNFRSRISVQRTILRRKCLFAFKR